MNILTVVGARPQFVKAAVVGSALQELGPGVRLVTVHTGQHYDFNMSEVFFEQLGLPAPNYHLGIGGLTSASMTARMTEGIEQVLHEERPDTVLVYGDTDSTLAGALASAKFGVRLAHVEAGLRSFDKSMPEEINRVLTDHVADLLYTTSDAADANLKAEGISGQNVLQVGDVMYDACLRYSSCTDIAKVEIPVGPFLLATLHRAAATDNPQVLANAIEIFDYFAREIKVVLPLHPRTKSRAAAAGLLSRLQRACHVIEPIGYLDMLKLLKACVGVVTDSGGLQKEAFYMGKRCVVLRDRTEWIELVVTGQARLLDPVQGPDLPPDTLSWLQQAADSALRLYGSGEAAKRIARHLTA